VQTATIPTLYWTVSFVVVPEGAATSFLAVSETS
jgi:hypothetical protein